MNEIEPISISLSREQLEAVDVWRLKQEDHPSRSDAIVRLIDNALRVPEALDTILHDVQAAYGVMGEEPSG